MLNVMEQFEAFCRTKPADEAYTYRNAQACAVAMFALSIGMGDRYYGFSDEKKITAPDAGYIFAEAETYAATKPHTYGALADRIKARIYEDALVG